MSGLRSGGLFAGYGGLEMAISEVFGAEPAWFSEIEPGPSKILAHHWPTVPNHGDITKIDWDQVEPVDILAGGFPCQDVSLAGKRAGLTPDSRSGLWNHFAYAISKLRPRYVVAENVRGLLSAEAHSDVEPCPWCLGEGSGEPDLRALGAVLGDLAELGYDAQWCGLRAADVGAPHGRYRVFILARDTEVRGRDGARPEVGGWEPTRPTGGSGRAAADTDGTGGRESLGSGGPREATFGGQGKAWTRIRHDAAGGAGAAADAASERQQGRELVERVGKEVARSCSYSSATADAQSDGRHEGWTEPAGEFGGSDAAERGASPAAWGQYGAAVERWERILGRVAPAPTEPNTKGSQRLSPQFVEWMMGLPAGHVTAVPGVNRNAQLKALGNGVVVQQASAALHHMHTNQQLLASA